MNSKTSSNKKSISKNKTKKVSPNKSKCKKRTAIIVPFRDDKDNIRSNQLKQFLSYMKSYLSDSNCYDIFIIEQSDDGRKFNRGKLLNIGYKIAQSLNKYTHLIFHDVDLLPSSELLPYYLDSGNNIVHIAKVWKRYDSDKYFGGVVTFPVNLFKKINGFPNNFWGWGGEDDELYIRAVKNGKMKVEHPTEGSYNDLENKNLKEKLDYLRNNKSLKCLNKQELLRKHRIPAKTNGISSLNYNELFREMKDHVIKVTVDVLENDHWTDNVCGINNVMVGSPEKKTRKMRDKYDLSSFNLSYDDSESCRRGSKLPFMTDPKEFYNLLPKRLVLKKTQRESDSPKELKYEIYQDLERKSVVDTFNYLFYNIRMGIFVYIKNNKLHYFIPFQNMDYKNNWSSKMKFKKNMSFDDYFKEKEKYLKRKDDSLQTDLTKWSANNCLIGNWTDNEVGDMGWYEVRDMISQACNNHKINDCIFFINRRDHPVLTPNRTEPYFHIFNNITTPLSQHKYDKYVPIMSFSKNQDFADLLIPNYADWRNVTGKLYPTQCVDMEKDKIIKDWSKKASKAIFRGSATGCGTSPEDNQRINLSKISKEFSKNKDTKDLLDAGLVGKNLRDKKFMGKEIDFFRFKDYDLMYSERKSMNEQSKYKYIIHIDGHVSAYRLGKELSLCSTILKVDSMFNYKLWFSNHLHSGQHYLPIKKDLSNIKKVVKWCKSNDDKCEKIANNSKKLYDKLMTKKHIVGYFAWMINSISQNYKI
jgi:hypothetical protein